MLGWLNTVSLTIAEKTRIPSGNQGRVGFHQESERIGNFTCSIAAFEARGSSRTCWRQNTSSHSSCTYTESDPLVSPQYGAYIISITSIFKSSAIEEQNNRKRCPARLPHQSKPWIKLIKNSWTAVSHDADNLMESNSVVFPCPQTWFTWLGTRRPSPRPDWASAADRWGPH